MISLLGSSLILLALVFCLTGLGLNALYLYNRHTPFYIAGRRAMTSASCLVLTAGITLLYALITSNFSLEYVSRYSSAATPLVFKISGFWAGMEGSLLFWVFILSLYTLLVLYQNRKKYTHLMPWVLMVIAMVQGFFLLICCFFENPFQPVDATLTGTSGMNPLLQHWAMLIHPPMLYMGFIGFTVPYAYAVAAMATQKLDASWIRLTRKWTLTAWLILSAAVVMGGKWAYMELGWGGYWAWDPVENASFLPWLTGTAYIHSVLIQEKKNMLKRWNMILIMLTFTLTIFGTYLTRSGIISSVHAFAATELGIWFLGFVIFLVILNISLLVYRRKDLSSQNQLDSFASREAGFVFNNLIFIAMMLVVLWGTMYPLITEALRGVQLKLGPTWFNLKIIPFGLVLLALTGIAPLLAWRKTSLKSIRKNLLLPLLLGLIGACIGFVLGIRQMYPLISSGLIGFVFGTIILEFYRGIHARRRTMSESAWTAFITMISKNRSRYGGYIVHLGILMIFIGFTGKVFDKEADVSLSPLENTTQLEEYTFILKDYWSETSDTHPVKRSNHDAKIVSLDIFKKGEYHTTMAPEKRIYTDQNSQPHSEVALKTSLNKDLYIILGSLDMKTGMATLKIRVNHMVTWVWLGTLVLVLGSLIALNPFEKKR